MALNYGILFIASALEIAWAVGLKYSDSLLDWIVTIICVIGSFIGLVLASRRMSAALAYILFVIFGTIGSYCVDIYFFGKELSLMGLSAIIVMLICVAILNGDK